MFLLPTARVMVMHAGKIVEFDSPEKLLQKQERRHEAKIDKRPPCCMRCEYYQPKFKYRTCLFVRCPMDKSLKTIRARPLRSDKFAV